MRPRRCRSFIDFSAFLNHISKYVLYLQWRSRHSVGKGCLRVKNALVLSRGFKLHFFYPVLRNVIEQQLIYVGIKTFQWLLETQLCSSASEKLWNYVLILAFLKLWQNSDLCLPSHLSQYEPRKSLWGHRKKQNPSDGRVIGLLVTKSCLLRAL